MFPGGCFFAVAAADVGTRPGAVRDAVAAQQRDWIQLLERLARKAMEVGELESGVDPTQLAFELNAILVSASTTSFSRATRRCSTALERRSAGWCR